MPADWACRVVAQPQVNALLVEHVEAPRHPLHHLPVLHLAETHRAHRRRAAWRPLLAVMLLVRRDVIDGDYPRPAAHRRLPREHVDATAAALSSLHHELRQHAPSSAAAAAPKAPYHGTGDRARAPARQAEQPRGGAQRRDEDTAQRRPREEHGAEGRVDAGADANPDDEEEGEHDHVPGAVRRPRAVDERVDEEARAADADQVGDGQPEHAEEAVHRRCGPGAAARSALALRLVELSRVAEAEAAGLQSCSSTSIPLLVDDMLGREHKILREFPRSSHVCAREMATKTIG